MIRNPRNTPHPPPNRERSTHRPTTGSHPGRPPDPTRHLRPDLQPHPPPPGPERSHTRQRLRHNSQGSALTRPGQPQYRVRNDHVDTAGHTSLRLAGRMHHLGVGRAYAGTPALILTDPTTVTVINTTTGQVPSERRHRRPEPRPDRREQMTKPRPMAEATAWTTSGDCDMSRIITRVGTTGANYRTRSSMKCTALERLSKALPDPAKAATTPARRWCPRRLTPTHTCRNKARMLKEYQDGVGTMQLAKLYGIDRETVRATLRRAGLPQHERGLSAEQIEPRRSSCMPPASPSTRIGKRFNVDAHTVRRRLLERQVAMR